MNWTGKKIAFILLFGALALVGSRINFSQVLGAENQYFTLFQFFGPIAGGFLGSIAGAIAVLAAQTANFVLVGTSVDFINLARLLPMLFAAYYFGTTKKKDWSVAVPLVCMALFVLHPVGREAWFYSLYWLIPLGVKLLAPERLFFKSLGATFVAHSIGGTIWLYSLPSTPAFWVGLIPIVAYERGLFAIGITVSYLGMNTLLNKIEHKIPKGILNINPKYDLTKMIGIKKYA